MTPAIYRIATDDELIDDARGAAVMLERSGKPVFATMVNELAGRLAEARDMRLLMAKYRLSGKDILEALAS